MTIFDLPDNCVYLAALADKQLGIVATRQLDGLSRRAAANRVSAGRWQRLYWGVYAVHNGPIERRSQIWAAILRCGCDAVASHQTAAELDGLVDRADDWIHVTVGPQTRVRGRLTGIRVHHAARLPLSRHPARNPPRTRIDDTILDLIETSRTARAVASWVSVAVQNRRTTPERLARALARRKKFRWRAMVEAIVHDVSEGAHTPLELTHLNRVERAHGLPRGERQHRHVVNGQTSWHDVRYTEYGVRVELDGRAGHVGDGAFRDRRRDNRGVVEGDITLRYGHADVFGTPCEVAAEQALVLQSRGWTGAPRRCGPTCAIP